MQRAFLVSALALALVIATGAHAQAKAAPAKPAASAAAPALAMVDAVVKRIDVDKGLIVLNHGEITNLAMPPMQMGFDVADRKMLKGVKAGQKVRFHAEIIGGKTVVTALEPAR